jgi:outer membrane protein assembly factor BamB
MIRRFLLLVLCALSLQACSWFRNWGDPEPGDPAELVEFDTTVKVKKIWSTGIGDGMGKAGLAMAPVYVNGKLYAADYEGRLIALDAENGNKLWSIKTKQPFSGGPAVGDELLVMGTVDGAVIAFDVDTGNERWSARVSSEVLAVAGFAADVVVVRGIDGRVFGLDAETGARLWIHDHSVPLLT